MDLLSITPRLGVGTTAKMSSFTCQHEHNNWRGFYTATYSTMAKHTFFCINNECGNTANRYEQCNSCALLDWLCHGDGIISPWNPIPICEFKLKRRCIECDDILHHHAEEDEILCGECYAVASTATAALADADVQNPFIKMFCDGCETDCPITDNFLRTGFCDSCSS